MKEFDYAIEYSKTFITLASLLIGLTLTFASNITANSPAIVTAMLVAWLFWIISIFLGTLGISDVTSLVAAHEDDVEEDDVSDGSSGGHPSLEDHTVFNPTLTRHLRWQRNLFAAGFVVAIGAAFFSQLASGVIR